MNTKPFGVQRAEESLGLLLWQGTTLWQRRIRAALEPYGLAHAQFVILAILLWCEVQGIVPTQITLVKFSKLDKMTVSNVLKKLTERGVTMRVVSQDTRAKDVRLTTEGRTLAKTLVPLVEGVDAAFFGQLDHQDQQTLLRILGILTRSTPFPSR